MTPMKKTLTAAGLGAAMFVGGVFGVATADVSIAGAQASETPAEESVETEQDADQTDRAAHRAERKANRAERKAIKAERRAEVAELLDMTADEFSDARADSTIVEIAEAQGVDVQVIVDYFVNSANERIDQAVADGDLTEEEAAEKRAAVAEKVEAKINGERSEGGHGRDGRRGNKTAQNSETI